jgi:hypothetical protein
MDNDTFQRQLYSHPIALQQLTQGYLPSKEAAHFNFATLEPYKATFISTKGKRRESDCIWRLRNVDDTLWLYLLIEFQSATRSDMAQRMLAYVALLRQDIDKHHQENGIPKDAAGGPLILPIVIYNGEAAWAAATEFRHQVGTWSLYMQRYQPKLRYLLLDVARLHHHQANRRPNLIAAVFRTTHPKQVEGLVKAVVEIRELVKPNPDLTALLSRWSKQIHAGNPEYTERIDFIWQDRSKNMSAQQIIDQWIADKTQIGIKQGIKIGQQQGIEIGQQQGIEIGQQQGIEIGQQQGIEIGRTEGQRETLIRLLERKFGSESLSAANRKRVAKAENGLLESWLDRVLVARSVNEVFSSKRSH